VLTTTIKECDEHYALQHIPLSEVHVATQPARARVRPLTQIDTSEWTICGRQAHVAL
jgi:hypothetical protein